LNIVLLKSEKAVKESKKIEIHSDS